MRHFEANPRTIDLEDLREQERRSTESLTQARNMENQQKYDLLEERLKATKGGPIS